MIIVLFLNFLVWGCSKTHEQVVATDVSSRKLAIASLLKFINKVETKKNSELIYTNAKLNYQFQNYDYLKTYNKAYATILFKDHSRLLVEENSIIVVVDRVEQEDSVRGILNVERGAFTGEILPSSGKKNVLEITLKKTKLRITNIKNKTAKFHVNIKERDIVEIKNIAGRVEYEKSDSLNNPNYVKLKPRKNKIIIIPSPILKKDKKVLVTPVKTIARVPFFKIVSPSKNLSTKGTTFTVSGKAINVEIRLNGQKLKIENGVFKKKISLILGVNLLTFQITSGEEIEYKVFKVIKK